MIGYLQIFEFFFPRDRNENATVEVVLSEHIDLKMVGQSSDVDIPKNLINVLGVTMSLRMALQKCHGQDLILLGHCL